MSNLSPNPQNMESTEEDHERRGTVTTTAVDENETTAEQPMNDCAEVTEAEEMAVEFPVDETDERLKELEKMDIPTEVDENGIPAEHPIDDGSTVTEGEEMAVEFPASETDERPKESKKMDMPSLELSDNEFNSTDSDSFAGMAQKNRTLELKLSAIIEKACSSDVEAESLPEAEPTLPVANVTVSLPNNELLFTVEGVNVPPPAASHEVTQETAVLSADPAKSSRLRSRKKYMYKLKSKGGVVLKYSSYVPVVLKKPRICLTRIDLETELKSRGRKKASMTSLSVNGKRSRGRPTKATPTPVATDDTLNGTDVKSNESSSSFGMQTRKRKLKFLPDGRLMCIAKRRRSSSSSASVVSDDIEEPPAKESTDDDWEASGDDLKELNMLSEMKEAAFEVRKSAVKSQTPKLAKPATPKSPKSATPQLAKVDYASRGWTANNSNGGKIVSSPKPRPHSVVNPAQLLSTLLGVTIRPSQLNTVCFKPKSVQKQHPSLQKTIVLTGEELRGVAANFRSSTALNASKQIPLMQKIFPKSSLTSIFDKTVTVRRSPSIPDFSSTSPSRDLVSPPIAAEVPCEVPSFDDFTDSRTVRTKAGPKKLLLHKERQELSQNEKLNRLAVYELAQCVFDHMPSWNLHLMPDTNTFCLAQVGRGRMGIPILRKSVELNEKFAAKIYVHQLHCKKFDGVYDTRAKINSLISEIDSLAT